MDIKISVQYDPEWDGVDQKLTLEEVDTGDSLSDILRVMETFLSAMGFTYVEKLEAHKSSGDTVSSHDVN